MLHLELIKPYIGFIYLQMATIVEKLRDEIVFSHSDYAVYAIYANNKGADQPAHPRILISAFDVRCLDSILLMLSKPRNARLLLASVAEQTGLSLNWAQTPDDRFSHDVAQINCQLLCKYRCSADRWLDVCLAEPLV